ncbi:MAG: hypothetical protein ACKOWN_04865 [Microbacteriaceae bacterium]
MSNKILAAGSVALMGAGSLLFGATPANAFGSDECGLAPGDGSIRYTDGYCSLTFDEAGDHTWTVPSNASEVWAFIVGAGGGASGRVNVGEGYAGGGGDVQFYDLSDEAAGTELDIYVGAGGTSVSDATTAAESGEDSSIDVGTDSWSAEGGAGNEAGGSWLWGFCGASDFLIYAGEGTSYFPGDLTAPSGDACINGVPGYLPSEELDTPDIFSDYDYTVGQGGGVVPVGWTANQAGTGANVYYDDDTDTLTMDEAGSDGLVIVRWIPTGALASTGVDANSIGMTAGALSLGGIALAVVAAARRARRNK